MNVDQRINFNDRRSGLYKIFLIRRRTSEGAALLSQIKNTINQKKGRPEDRRITFGTFLLQGKRKSRRSMASPGLDKAKLIWSVWNLRAAILISLFAQMLLIFIGRLRKREGHKLVIASIWIAYLLADWIAIFAIGLISNGQNNDLSEVSRVNDDVAAFWAPFLLLHLGGPDDITAFSLEDNELWIRHLFSLIIKVVVVVVVLSKSIPNEFTIPTVLILLVGTFKYAERTRARYLACMRQFKSSILPKPNAGPNYAQLMEKYTVREAAEFPVEIEIINVEYQNVSDRMPNQNGDDHGKPLVDDKDKYELCVLENAYVFFKIFRGLIVDYMFGPQDRDRSRKFFMERYPKDAFRVLEVELSFIYDTFYTKMAVVHKNVMWYVFRLICSVLIVVCLVLFATHPRDELQIDPFDVILTYILLLGAFFLDSLAWGKLIFSDWTIVLIENSNARGKLSFGKKAVLEKFSLGKLSYRWSNAIGQHNLISLCLNQRWKWIDKIAGTIGLKEFLDEIQYKKNIAIEDNITEIIFKDLKLKALNAKTREDVKRICSARGNSALSNRYPEILSSVSEKVEYDESLLLWHIATDLCYTSRPESNNANRKFCKEISDYMLDLLVMRPAMMSTVAGIGQIRVQDTVEEAKRFFSNWKSELFSPVSKGMDLDSEKHNEACKRLLSVNTVVKPIEVKGDRSKSVLFDACMLAKELLRLEGSIWEIMSQVWVELLCYAACHLPANAHVYQLSEGGELITFVWLLMAHFGLGEQFRIEAGTARAKIIVGNSS
ncbi:hypothetical protein ACH5RR_031543 [Cinchona calisaya]|uniref:DUF4220 domain-containing protein n=1 Tax=Cinchona calisaya TaxID=153742 RepID=A0ABD2YGW8_9GENT